MRVETNYYTFASENMSSLRKKQVMDFTNHIKWKEHLKCSSDAS